MLLTHYLQGAGGSEVNFQLSGISFRLKNIVPRDKVIASLNPKINEITFCSKLQSIDN